jgi:hypothetical protein
MKKSLAESDRKIALVRGKNVQRMAVFSSFEEPEIYKQALQYVFDLKKRGIKTVDFYLAFENKKSQDAFESKKQEICFSPADFNLVGKYKNQELKDKLSQEYDLLIDLTEGASLAADVVIAKTNAKWKAGRANDERSFLLDFMIQQPKEKGLKSLIHYLDDYLMKFNSAA